MGIGVGQVSQLGIDSATPVTVRQDFLHCDIGADETFIDANGLKGTLSPHIARVRQGPRRIHGSLSMQPNVLEMQQILPWILGTAVSGTTYALADTALSRYVEVDRAGSSNKASYDSVAVNRATFHGGEFQPLGVDLDLLGVDETISGSFPSLSINESTGPWVFTDLALSINSTTVHSKNFNLTIDNHLDADWFLNSLTLSAIVKLQRTIMFSCEVAHGDYTALYNTGAGGVAVVVVFTNAADATKVLTFSLVKVALPRHPLPIVGRTENMMTLAGQAYKTGSTAELVTTLATS